MLLFQFFVNGTFRIWTQNTSACESYSHSCCWASVIRLTIRLCDMMPMFATSHKPLCKCLSKSIRAHRFATRRYPNAPCNSSQRTLREPPYSCGKQGFSVLRKYNPSAYSQRKRISDLYGPTPDSWIGDHGQAVPHLRSKAETASPQYLPEFRHEHK